MPRALLAIALFALAGCGSSSSPFIPAAPLQYVADQTMLPFTGGNYASAGPSFDTAQTFTVGLAGNLWTIELPLERQGNTEVARFELRTTTGGVPDDGPGAVLASTIVHASGVPRFGTSLLTTLTFPASVPLIPGDVVAIVMVHVGGGSEEILWVAEPGDPYSQGALFSRTAGDGNVFAPLSLDWDLGFRTTMAIP